jgi:hypothetical protein
MRTLLCAYAFVASSFAGSIVGQELPKPPSVSPQEQPTQPSQTAPTADDSNSTKCQTDLQGCQTQLSQAIAASKAAQATVTRLQEENTKLNAVLAQRDADIHNSLPDVIELVKLEWLSYQSVVVTFGLNRGGGMQVRLLDPGQGRTAVQTITKGYALSHTIKFSSLLPDHDYEVDATVLDWSGRATKIIATPAMYPSSLKFHSHTLEIASAMEARYDPPTDKRVVFHFSSTGPLLLQVSCNKFQKGTTAQSPCGSQGAPFQYDFASRITGGISVPPGADTQVVFELEPATEYAFHWEARTAQEGSALPDPPSGFPRFTTPPAPEPFDFKDTFSITLTGATVEVSWSATVAPTAAHVELELLQGSSVLTVPEKIAGSQITISVPIASIQSKLPTGTQKQEPLKLKAVMSRGAEEKSASFAIAIKIPTAASVTGDQHDAVENIRNAAASNSGKVRWADVARIGLPLLLNFL